MGLPRRWPRGREVNVRIWWAVLVLVLGCAETEGGDDDTNAPADGRLAAVVGDCDGDGDGYRAHRHGCDGRDCDDTEPTAHPGGVQMCDGVDGDCDGTIDDQYQDGDGDGAWPCGGDCDDTDPSVAPTFANDGTDGDHDGYGDTDCDDCDPEINPGAPEVDGNAVDEDCDGRM